MINVIDNETMIEIIIIEIMSALKDHLNEIMVEIKIILNLIAIKMMRDHLTEIQENIQISLLVIGAVDNSNNHKDIELLIMLMLNK